jgi:hypothetical protein
LGIDIPGAWPDCGMEVNKEAKICEEGKSSSLSPHFPDELPDFGMRFAPTL